MSGGRTGDIRILAAGMEPLAEFRETPSRNARVFVELDRRYDVVGAIRPTLTALEKNALRLRYFYPNRIAWRGRAGLNPWRFKRLSAVAEKQLRALDGRYDLILLWQTVFAPGLHPGQRPYAVYTDNIYPLTKRFLPAWAPLGRRTGRRWAQCEQHTCQRARYVFTMTDFLRDAVIEDYGCDPARVITVGAGTNTFLESLGDRRYDSGAVLFVGFNFALKGGHVLLRAWQTVRQHFPDAELWIAGPSHPRAPEQPGVRWLGLLEPRELSALYDRAAVFVLPSLYDACPHALREAMGHGLPCIGTRRGGIPEMIDHERTGLLVEPEDPAELADALVAILEDPTRAEAMGRAGHAEIVRAHRWRHVADRMAPYIDKAAGEPGPHRFGRLG
jgi:glycosyltransferase involved in cell wall biosynthesis